MSSRAGRLPTAAAVLFLLCLPAPAIAQDAPPGAPPFAGWRDGFVLESAGGEYRLQFNGLFQVDGRFALEEAAEMFDDTLLMRRVRPMLQGRLARYFEFNLQPDFAGSTLNLRTAFIETRLSPALRIRIGKDKQPLGLERLHSSSNLLFIERSLTSTVFPDRDLGIQALGDLAGGRISYQGGLFNGAIDGANLDTDTNDGKDFVGRVVARPWAADKGRPLAGLGLALAGSVGPQPEALPSFRSPGQRTFLTYRPGAEGVGTRTRISPQAFYYYKRFGGYAEYVRSLGDVELGGRRDEVSHAAWQVAGSFVVTGEPASERGVRPARPFDPLRGEWGALQLAVRYHVLDIGPGGAVFTSGPRRARAFGVGANWYLNQFIKWMLNFEHTDFDESTGTGRPSETMLIFRHQLFF